MRLAVPLILGINWMDPNWLLQQYHAQFFWLSLAIVFAECGLFFPILPGDTLLFAVGLFVAGGQLGVNLVLALVAFTLAALLGNVVGYEIGRRLGPPLLRREGRIIRRAYIEKTGDFFDRHGHKALVIGRFVPIVRTYVTVVAGVTRMDRRRFAIWSGVGALLWVPSITLLGYFLGAAFPALGANLDKAIIVIFAFSLIPIAYEWRKHRREQQDEREAH